MQDLLYHQQYFLQDPRLREPDHEDPSDLFGDFRK